MSEDSSRHPRRRYDGLRDLQRRSGDDEVPRGSRRRRSERPQPARPGESGLAALAVPRRRRWPRRALVGINIAVALALLVAGGAYAYVKYRLDQVDRVSVVGLVKAHGPFTILIVGSDSRDLSNTDDGAFGSTSVTPGQRSDTIMLVRVVPKTRTMSILSIPRDLWVPIQGAGDNRINSAFNNGPDLLVSTIESDLGIPINHYIEINFDSFQDITDAVGGVKFYFPTPAKDQYSNLVVPTAGCVNLTGFQALAFARSRHYEYYENGQWIDQGLSDLARIQRQQLFVKKMIKKAESKFTNPFALNGVIAGITKNLTVDKGFSSSLMLGLAEDFRTANVAGIPTGTLPTYNETIDGQEVLGLQQPQAQQVISQFNALGTTPASATTTATTAPRSHVPVEVANGSGVSGQAAAAAGALTRLGYNATATTQTPGYGFTGNEIEYAPDAHAAAMQLADQLANGATLMESTALSPTPYSLELVTGNDYAGIKGAHSTAAKASTSTSSAPAPTTTTTWLLPGPTPTAAELAAC